MSDEEGRDTEGDRPSLLAEPDKLKIIIIKYAIKGIITH